MKKITLEVPDRLLRNARTRAASEGTTVEREIRRWLDQYARDPARARRAITRLLKLAAKHGKGRRLEPWTRDEIHDRSASRAR